MSMRLFQRPLSNITAKPLRSTVHTLGSAAIRWSSSSAFSAPMPPTVDNNTVVMRAVPSRGSIALKDLAKNIDEDVLEELDMGLKGFFEERKTDFEVFRGKNGAWFVSRREIPLAPTTSEEDTPKPNELSPEDVEAQFRKKAAASNHPVLLDPKLRIRLQGLLRDCVPLEVVDIAVVGQKLGLEDVTPASVLHHLEEARPYLMVQEVTEYDSTTTPPTRRAVTYVSVVPIYRELIFDVDSVSRTFQNEGHVAEEYDAFRLARFMQTADFRAVEGLEPEVVDVVAKPIYHILLSYPHLFAFDTPAMERVRFILRPEFVPPECQLSPETIRSEIEKYKDLRKSYAPSENSQRVAAIRKFRQFQRALAIVAQPSPYVDPTVAAYALFDLMPTDAAVPTGELWRYLPDVVQEVTNVRDKKFLKSFPHLFYVFEAPPLFMVQRADLPRHVEEDGEISDEELIQSVVVVLASRLEGRKKRMGPVLPSHLHKYLPKRYRKEIRDRYTTIDALLEAHEGTFFVIDREAHKNEFGVSLVADDAAKPAME